MRSVIRSVVWIVGILTVCVAAFVAVVGFINAISTWCQPRQKQLEQITETEPTLEPVKKKKKKKKKQLTIETAPIDVSVERFVSTAQRPGSFQRSTKPQSKWLDD